MCAVVGLHIPLEQFGDTYWCMSKGNIVTYTQMTAVANTQQTGTVLSFLSEYTDKIKHADDLALVICEIKQIWNWAFHKRRTDPIDFEFFPSKVVPSIVSVCGCVFWQSSVDVLQEQARRALKTPPFSKQASTLVTSLYNRNKRKNRRMHNRVPATRKRIAIAAVETGMRPCAFPRRVCVYNTPHL